MFLKLISLIKIFRASVFFFEESTKYISEVQLLKILEGHINPKKVIKKLRTLKEKFGDKVVKRLSKK